jgi:hypothetical protein
VSAMKALKLYLLFVLNFLKCPFMHVCLSWTTLCSHCCLPNVFVRLTKLIFKFSFANSLFCHIYRIFKPVVALWLQSKNDPGSWSPKSCCFDTFIKLLYPLKSIFMERVNVYKL